MNCSRRYHSCGSEVFQYEPNNVDDGPVCIDFYRLFQTVSTEAYRTGVREAKFGNGHGNDCLTDFMLGYNWFKVFIGLNKL